MTVQAHIDGLRRNLTNLQERKFNMDQTAYQNLACCPSCFWGGEYTKVEEAIERREIMLRVMLCRKMGLRPGKYRLVLSRVRCLTCGGKGRTTMGSAGRCTCGESHCPGRGVCHTCYGTGWARGRKKIVTRKWPDCYLSVADAVGDVIKKRLEGDPLQSPLSKAIHVEKAQ
jgi:hypothetical protein